MLKKLHLQSFHPSLAPHNLWLLGVIAIFFLCALYVRQTHPPKHPPRIAMQEKPQRVIAAVLPHHDVLLPQFPHFYSLLSDDSFPVEKVFLLSPNHFQPEATRIKGKHTSFSFPTTQITVDDNVFGYEHGVSLHLPFIKETFPKAEVVPLLITRNIPQSSLDDLVTDLQTGFNEKTVILVSSDFSHYLPYAAAELKDALTLSLIKEGNENSILKLNDDHLDCPSCMYVLMKLLKTKELITPTVLFHGNSAEFLKLSAQEPTTGYYVLKW